MVSVESWNVDALYDLVRCAYAYQDHTQSFSDCFGDVGRSLSQPGPSRVAPRLAWDRVNNKLADCLARACSPYQRRHHPRYGSFSTYLPDGRTRLGELDEEFVYETRVGDTFMLGSQVWRVTTSPTTG